MLQYNLVGFKGCVDNVVVSGRHEDDSRVDDEDNWGMASGTSGTSTDTIVSDVVD